jgi:hypothetical protein
MGKPATIALEKFETGRHAFIAVNGDVQIGWCAKDKSNWYIEDMDGLRLAGPFRTIEEASKASSQVLARFAGESNPGW